MRHPEPQEWSDLVRGLAGPEATEEMRRHLDAGCRRCARQVEALEAVRLVAVADRRVEPPAHAVRSARNILRLQKLLEASRQPAHELSLSFDSFLTPAFAGTRAQPAEQRHLVYDSPRLRLELQVHSSGTSEPLCVDGQVFETGEGPVADLPVALVQEGRVASHDMSRRHGEFRLLGRSDRSAQLRLLVEDGQLVKVELPGLAS